MAKRVLTISVLENGKINVEGPLNDAILCFGLLEAAKDIIRDFSQRQGEAKRIVPVVTDLAKPNGVGI